MENMMYGLAEVEILEVTKRVRPGDLVTEVINASLCWKRIKVYHIAKTPTGYEFDAVGVVGTQHVSEDSVRNFKRLETTTQPKQEFRYNQQ